MKKSFFRPWATIMLLGLLFWQGSAVAVCTAGNPIGWLDESTPSADFTDNGDGTVTHKVSGLTWSKCSIGQNWDGSACTGTPDTFTWEEALRESVNRNAGNYLNQQGWRVPNAKELLSLVESCGRMPAINQAIFPDTPNDGNYWSSTTYYNYYGVGGTRIYDTSEAWYVNFLEGVSDYQSKVTNRNFLRLVRGGFDLDMLQSMTVLTATPPVADEGASVTLTATVSGNTVPTGTVNFYEGNVLIACDGGNQTLNNGVATCIIDNLVTGAHTYLAKYLGDTNNEPSNSDPLVYVVGVNLDIDANNTKDGLTDGLLVIRYLLGLRGDALIQGAVGAGCMRCTASEIEPYLEAMVAAGVLDVDASTTTSGLTDGLLVVRYLLGLRGDALIQEAVDQDSCQRCTAPMIENYLETL